MDYLKERTLVFIIKALELIDKALRFAHRHVALIIMIVVVLGVKSIANSVESLPFDSTDDIENQVRSGLGVYVDQQTGCEYVSTFFGGPTPRMAEDGITQLGCGNVEFDISSLTTIEQWRENNELFSQNTGVKHESKR